MENDGKQTEELVPSFLDPGIALWDRVRRNIKAACRELLTDSIIHEIQRFRAYTGAERQLYLKIRALNRLALANQKPSFATKKARSLLFVCFGNIMRSPMCEALTSRALAEVANSQIMVASAGLNAVPGRSAHPWAIAAARDFGIDLENHRAKLLTIDAVNQADLIFGMDYDNQVQILSRYPQAKNKVFMLGAYAGEDHRSVEIVDPYHGSLAGTRDCYTILGACVQNLVRSLADE